MIRYEEDAFIFTLAAMIMKLCLPMRIRRIIELHIYLYAIMRTF